MAIYEIGKATRYYDQGSPYTETFENNATGSPIYIGRAKPGTAKNATGWQIYKITYDGNGFVTDKQWASSTNLFDKIWDNRAGYSYG